MQVAHAVAELALAGVPVELAHVSVPGSHPLASAGVPAPPGLTLTPISRSWPWPLDALPPFSRWHSVRFFASRLQERVRRSRPQAVYVRHLKLARLLLAERTFPPLFYEAHEVFADTASASRRAAVAADEAAVVRGAAGVVCNSRATAERLTELYGPIPRLLVLPNGVTPPDSLPEKPWFDCRRHVIYAGSFFGWKGVADLLYAAQALDGFHITLIGGTPEQVARMCADRPSGGATLEFLPRIAQPEVMDRLSRSCIAVLPNRPQADSRFTSPIKLFEYMAAGCAVVAADLPAIREILSPDEATWFPAGNGDALAGALAALADAPEKARSMGERVREKSRDYTWRARAARLKGFLASVQQASDR